MELLTIENISCTVNEDNDFKFFKKLFIEKK